MRVRVCLVDGAVRSPAGVGNTRLAGQGLFTQQGFQLSNFANTAALVQRATRQHGHAGRVVAAIFQAVQAFEQDGGDIALRHSADDSTHQP